MVDAEAVTDGTHLKTRMRHERRMRRFMDVFIGTCVHYASTLYNVECAKSRYRVLILCRELIVSLEKLI